MADLSRLYGTGFWPSRPDDPAAIERFERAIKVLKYLLNTHPFMKRLCEINEVKLLDVAAGSGIGGAAFARALIECGADRVDLVAVDARPDDLGFVAEWVKGLETRVRTRVAPVERLYEVLRNELRSFDAAIMWGGSAPHFNPYDMLRVYANVAELLKDDGVFIEQETDALHRVLFLMGYERIYAQKELPDGKVLVTVHHKYDAKRGTYYRGWYVIPGFHLIEELPVTFWFIGTLAGLGWSVFKDVDIVTEKEHGVALGRHIILFRSPRRNLIPEELLVDPTVLKGRDDG